jgi:hypothetical protein
LAARPEEDDGGVDERDPVTTLRRWEDSGALWRVVGRRAGTVTVALVTCDGGEEVHRLTSGDAGLLRYVSGRETSED